MVDEDFLASRRDNEHLLVVVGWDLAPLDELHDFLDDLGRLVFLDDVAAVSDDMHLVLAHLARTSQFSVQSLGPSQEEHPLGTKREETLSQATEPLCPIVFGREQISPPDVFLETRWPVCHLTNLGWHGDSCAPPVFDLAPEDTILDH